MLVHLVKDHSCPLRSTMIHFPGRLETWSLTTETTHLLWTRLFKRIRVLYAHNGSHITPRSMVWNTQQHCQVAFKSFIQYVLYALSMGEAWRGQFDLILLKVFLFILSLLKRSWSTFLLLIKACDYVWKGIVNLPRLWLTDVFGIDNTNVCRAYSYYVSTVSIGRSWYTSVLVHSPISVYVDCLHR